MLISTEEPYREKKMIKTRYGIHPTFNETIEYKGETLEVTLRAWAHSYRSTAILNVEIWGINRNGWERCLDAWSHDINLDEAILKGDGPAIQDWWTLEWLGNGDLSGRGFEVATHLMLTKFYFPTDHIKKWLPNYANLQASLRQDYSRRSTNEEEE